MKDLKDSNILYLVHRYADFQKDQIEILSRFFKNVYVIVRYKPIADLSKLIGIKSLNMHSLKYSVQLQNMPKNIFVYLAPVFYFPTNKGYRNLGEKHYKAVLKIIRKNQITFDIIHSHFAWSAGYVGMKLKNDFKKPFVLTTHGYDIYDLPFRANGWKNLIKKVIYSADVNITVNKKNLVCFRKIGILHKKITIIPNGYNNELFFPTEQKKARLILNLPTDDKILLSVGHIEMVKGHCYLIKGMYRLKNKNIRCIVIGEGFLRKKMINQVNKHNLKNTIDFVGPKLHHEINCWMNACDLFVLPSISESFGIVQLEAMACGKPIVATVNGGSENLIASDDYGLLCEKQNPEDLADKIEMALYKKWDTKKIINYSNRFSWDKICEQMSQIYEKLVFSGQS